MTKGKGWIKSPDIMFVNGVSSNDVGLYVDTPPMPIMSQQGIETYSISGRAESVSMKTGNFNDITLSVRCFVFENGYHPQDIYKYLYKAKTVYFSSAKDYFYKVKQTISVNPSYQTGGKNFLNVQFLCSPFRWSFENEPEEVTPEDAFVRNRGNIYSEPVYTIDLDGNGSITVNGQTLSFTDLSGVVCVDVPRRKIYQDIDGTLTVVQEYTSGKFWIMILEEGYNEIKFSGGVKSVFVTKNERWV